MVYTYYVVHAINLVIIEISYRPLCSPRTDLNRGKLTAEFVSLISIDPMMTHRSLNNNRYTLLRGNPIPAMSRRVRAKVAEKQVLVPIAEGTEEMEVGFIPVCPLL